MKLKAFVDTIRDDIVNYLPADYADAEITIHNVTKNNDTKLTALCVRKKGSSIAPSINLDGFYEWVENGSMTIEDVCKNISRTVIDQDDVNPLSDLDVSDFDAIKSRIKCKLVNAAANDRYLKDKPHRYMEDLAICYYIDLCDQNMRAGINLTYDMLDTYGVSTNDVHNIAIQNMENNKSVKIYDTIDIFNAHVPPIFWVDPDSISPDQKMYTVYNTGGIYDAAYMLCENIMDQLSAKYGGDFIIIPSSTNEFLTVPTTAIANDVSGLSDIIREVNVQEVRDTEILSDHSYLYDSATKTIVSI